MIQKRLILIMTLAGILAFSGCAAEPAQQPVTEPAAPTMEEPAQDPQPADPPVTEPAPSETPEVPEMTLEELAQYNGKNGQRAYIAIDGVVYDVTDVPPWAGGTHQGKVEAGIDGSEIIGQSPHGKKVLEKLPVVGKIKQ